MKLFKERVCSDSKVSLDAILGNGMIRECNQHANKEQFWSEPGGLFDRAAFQFFVRKRASKIMFFPSYSNFASS